MLSLAHKSLSVRGVRSAVYAANGRCGHDVVGTCAS